MGKITELSQGSLNGLRRQLNECIENAYNKGYADGKKEPREVKAVNVEDTSEYQIGYKVGYADGKKQAISEIPEVANKENEMYDRGVEDLSKAIVWSSNLKHSERVKYIGGNLGIYRLIEDTPQKLIEGFKAYEEKKKAEEKSIKVGDEIQFNFGAKGIVISIQEDWYRIVCESGFASSWKKYAFKKTGRNFSAEVSQLLDKLKGDNK